MDDQKKETCQKKNGREVSFAFKLFVIDQIANGQISANFASQKYNISRSTIHYWMSKLTNYQQKKTAISKDDQIKRLKDRVEELECIKDLQQDIIVEFEKVTGEEYSKKSLPEWLANEIQRRKKKLSK